MSRKASDGKLLPQQERFCVLIASGEVQASAYLQAGYKCSVKNAGRTAGSLLAKPYIQARIAELSADSNKVKQEQVEAWVSNPEIVDATSRIGRVNELVERRKKLIRFTEERGRHPDMFDVPGGRTGYVTLQWKELGKQLIKTYHADTDLSKEMRAIDEQIAKELGQWIEKRQEVLTAQQIMSMPVFEEILRLLAEEGTTDAPQLTEGAIIDIEADPETETDDDETGEQSDELPDEKPAKRAYNKKPKPKRRGRNKGSTNKPVVETLELKTERDDEVFTEEPPEEPLTCGCSPCLACDNEGKIAIRHTQDNLGHNIELPEPVWIDCGMCSGTGNDNSNCDVHG